MLSTCKVTFIEKNLDTILYVAEKSQYLQQFFFPLLLERGAVIDSFQSYQWILENFTDSLHLLL